MQRPIRIGTRGSALALAQTEQLCQRLAQALGLSQAAQKDIIDVKIIKTKGDLAPTTPIEALGNKGVFIKELESALFANQIDVAVHSTKDMLPSMPKSLTLAATLERGDPREALILHKGKTLADLAPGARFGTSSPRRRAQILSLRPDLFIVPIRGNVETRLHKVKTGEVDATLLAVAGLERLSRLKDATCIKETTEVLPALCQGTIGLQCRRNDESMIKRLGLVNHEPTFLCAAIERRFLAEMNASCTTAIAGLAIIDKKDKASFKVQLFHTNGEKYYRIEQTRTGLKNIKDANQFGSDMAEALKTKALSDGFPVTE